jgi:hypothetical protein
MPIRHDGLGPVNGVTVPPGLQPRLRWQSEDGCEKQTAFIMTLRQGDPVASDAKTVLGSLTRCSYDEIFLIGL